MILVGLGANLPSAAGSPRQTIQAAMNDLENRGIGIIRRSRWYASPAWPPSEQPWFVNAVVAVRTKLDPIRLLEQLHAVERAFGRQRTVKNVARVLDLDLLAYDNLTSALAPALPHPRLGERAFVLLPMRDVAPGWRHPITGASIEMMIDRLPANHRTTVIEEV